jgi:hypothetical protein
MTDNNWYPAKKPDYLDLLSGIRHRLANAAAPLAVLVELLDDDITLDMADASKRSVAKVERILTLLSSLSGHRLPDVTAVSLPVDLQISGMPVFCEPIINALLRETAPDALKHGATKSLILFESNTILWHDNGRGFSTETLNSLGLRQPGGEHGCGLGLAAICSIASSRGLSVEASNLDGAMLRFSLPLS